MKKILSGLFVGLLVIIFVTCVYAGDTDQRFSLEKWLTNLASCSPERSLGEDLIVAWTKNYYFFYESNEEFGSYFREREDYSSAYDGDEEVLEVLSQIPLFFERLWASVRIIVDHVRMILDWSKVLLPWNATVPWTRGEAYV